MASRSLRVWRFSDGRPGHETQSLGLLRALRRRLPLDVTDLPAEGAGRILFGNDRRVTQATGRAAPTC